MGLTIVFIGAGNVATHMAKAFQKTENKVLQVYSRTLEHARLLAEEIHADYTIDARRIRDDADAYIFSIKDDALPYILPQLPNSSGIWIHTAGSVPMDVFANYTRNYGVIYPLQTFSKKRSVNFADIPLFIEASNLETRDIIKMLATTLSSKVYDMESEKRHYLHLSAVFACNFVTHMYTLAADIIEKEGIPFEVLQPLIAETAAKITEISPRDAQTGPAVRFDQHVMKKHLELIKDKTTKQIYRLLSESIYKYAAQNDQLRLD